MLGPHAIVTTEPVSKRSPRSGSPSVMAVENYEFINLSAECHRNGEAFFFSLLSTHQRGSQCHNPDPIPRQISCHWQSHGEDAPF